MFRESTLVAERSLNRSLRRSTQMLQDGSICERMQRITSRLTQVLVLWRIPLVFLSTRRRKLHLWIFKIIVFTREITCSSTELCFLVIRRKFMFRMCQRRRASSTLMLRTGVNGCLITNTKGFADGVRAALTALDPKGYVEVHQRSF